MLGLATHEPNFSIIREELKENKSTGCEICGQIGTFKLVLFFIYTENDLKCHLF